MVPCKSIAEEISFEWSHHRIWLRKSKVRNTLHVSGSRKGLNEEKFDQYIGNERNHALDSRTFLSEGDTFLTHCKFLEKLLLAYSQLSGSSYRGLKLQ